MGSAYRTSPLSSLGRSVTNTRCCFLPEQQDAVAQPLCEKATSLSLDTFRSLFKFPCGRSDLFDDFVGRLFQYEAVQCHHGHNRVIRIESNAMFGRDLRSELP